MLSSCRVKAPASSQPRVLIDSGVPEVATAELTRTISKALFRKNQLERCIDWNLSVSASAPGAGARLETMTDIISQADFKSAVTDSISIKRPCLEQFSDRVFLGKCTLNRMRGLQQVDYYYDFHEVFTSDELMKLCLKGGNKWDTVSRDSSAYEKASLEADQRQLKKLDDSIEKK